MTNLLNKILPTKENKKEISDSSDSTEDELTTKLNLDIKVGSIVFNKFLETTSKVTKRNEDGSILIHDTYDGLNVFDSYPGEKVSDINYRLATEAEIVEYTIALQFVNIGRVPFEFHFGDHFSYRGPHFYDTRSHQNHTEILKEEAISERRILLITAEEIAKIENSFMRDWSATSIYYPKD